MQVSAFLRLEKKMNREEWFPTSIYHDVINIEGLEDILQDIKKHQDGTIKSNRGGWQSDNLVDDERLADLIHVIEERALHVRNDLVKDGNGEFKVNWMWVNFNKKGSYNLAHVHTDCDLCGCLYVKTHKNCGKIFFEDPRYVSRMNDIKYSVQNRLAYDTIEYIPEDGKLLFFPNWLKHGVESNSTDEYRISIAFNMRLNHEG
jgi:uncharacterized protein (TIGR02466 family)